MTHNNRARGESLNMYRKKDLSRESEVLDVLAPAQKAVSGRAFIFGPAVERIHDGLVHDTVTHTATVVEGRSPRSVYYFKCLYYIVSDDRRRRGKLFAVTCPSQQR